MSSYRSAYENYYKNISNAAKVKKDKNGYLHIGKRAGNAINLKHGINIQSNDSLTNIFIKRVTRELTGATIFLFFFVALKYIPMEQVKGIHDRCKQLLNYNFNYDECLDTFGTFEIGNIKGEDLKIENLKVQVSNFIEYLKINTNNAE